MLLIAGMFVYRNCSPKTKAHFILTARVNSYNHNNGCPVNLYREYYRVFRGYMTTDANAVYLTDSASFRQYLGTYGEDGEHLTANCKGDSVLVTRTYRTNYVMGANQLKDTTKIPEIISSIIKIEYLKSYSLKELKAQNRFD
jgi:hypothetical protein